MTVHFDFFLSPTDRFCISNHTRRFVPHAGSISNKSIKGGGFNQFSISHTTSGSSIVSRLQFFNVEGVVFVIYSLPHFSQFHLCMQVLNSLKMCYPRIVCCLRILTTVVSIELSPMLRIVPNQGHCKYKMRRIQLIRHIILS